MAYEVSSDGIASLSTVSVGDFPGYDQSSLEDVAASSGVGIVYDLAMVIVGKGGVPIGIVNNLPQGWDINKQGYPSGWTVDPPNASGNSIIRDQNGTAQGITTGKPGGQFDSALLPQPQISTVGTWVDGGYIFEIEANTNATLAGHQVNGTGATIPITWPSDYGRDYGGPDGGPSR